VGDPADKVVLEKNAAGSTRVDATHASAQLLTLLKAGDGEAMVIDKTAYVRDTQRVLDAGAEKGAWVVAVAADPLMHAMVGYVLEPTALLFDKGGVYEDLANAEFSKAGGAWTATTKRGVVSVQLRDGKLSWIKDAELDVRFSWLDPEIRMPENLEQGDDVRKIVADGQAMQQLGGVAQMALGFQRSAAVMAAAMAQVPDRGGASTRNAAAVVAAVTPPPGQPGNKGVIVKISGPDGPITVWDGENGIKPAKADGLKPQWMQVATAGGSACVRLGDPAGSLGVSPTATYKAGAQVTANELSKNPDAWALVALATGTASACTNVVGAGTGW
jgi:hypothetical protein